jgi:PAS domain S-box-containing protein
MSGGRPAGGRAPRDPFAGEGEVAALARTIDWSATPLGLAHDWPERLRALVELVLAGGVPMALVWSAGTTLVYNDACAPLLGARHPRALGRSVLEVLAEWRDELMEAGARLARGEPVVLADTRLARPDAEGGDAWFTVAATAVRDESGAVAGALVTAIDATERVRAAAALRDEEARHRLVVEGARDYAIITLDREGCIVGWSPGATEVYGWTAEEAIGQPVAMTFTPEDRAAGIPDHERERAARDGWAPDVRWHQRSDGARVFIDGVTRRLDDAAGAMRGFVKIGQDVTERRRLEETLAETRRRLDESLRTARIAYWEWEPASGVVRDSASLDELLGLAAGAHAHVGSSEAPHGAALLHPDDRARYLTLVADALTRGEGWHATLRIVRPRDGAIVWLDERATAARDEATGALRVTGLVVDVTDRRRAEQAAERERVDVERAMVRRQLAEAEEDERRRLARELHDQLGQHLTALALGLAATREQLRGDASASAHLAQLEALVALMTRDARYLALELRPPELDDVGLESALESYVARWTERYGIAGETVVSGRGRPLGAEVGTALYRIAQEALTNVAKHAGARAVSVIVEHGDDHVRLIVEDDGRGFDVEAALERARTEGRLGLAGMRERARQLGGEVSVESGTRGGTTVYVRIPTTPRP